MSGSTFKILKQCLMCGNMFEAQKISTRYCSHKCNAKHYKLKAKLEKKHIAEQPIKQREIIKPTTTALNIALLKDKEFLTVKDVSGLFRCSTKTVYHLIKKGVIKAKRLSSRKTLIKRGNIDKLFE